MNLIQHFVNGKTYKGSSSKKGKVYNPATGDQESEVILGNKEDLNKTVEIAKKAYMNGTTLREEALKTGLFNEQEYDRLVNPKLMC